MNSLFAADIKAIQSINSVPNIMRVIAEITGLRWVCISRVTPETWTICAVHDQLGFGLLPGDEIDIASTFCDKVRQNDASVLIDNVSNNPLYVNHPIPKKFGFESYFSIPVYRTDGSFFGTLCGLDPRPADLTTPKTLDTLKLFAELLSGQIDTEARLRDAEAELLTEKETAELREQFVAVLGHDIRTPLAAMLAGAEVISMASKDDKIIDVARRIKRSGERIASLIDDVMDFTRGKMGGGLPVERKPSHELTQSLRHVVAELRSAYPSRILSDEIAFDGPVYCDTRRIAQLLSNLVVNAIVHGHPTEPIFIFADNHGGGMRISVLNRSVLIAPETISRLFQPFWRGQGRSKSAGLGLGLYIASAIAKSHGGVLSVDSDITRTVFTFAIAPAGS